MIVCAGKNETIPGAVPIGVGLVESAINLTRLCLMQAPEFILFAGTAGSYGEHDVFDIIESRGAAQIELAFWQGKSYTPIDNVITSEGLGIEHHTIINSSNYITTDPGFSKHFVRHGIGAENMEFFSVLSVAKEFNIPAGGIFVITNRCDANAHRDYMAHYPKALEILQQHLKERFV